jgi:hypothetical protein
MSNLPKPESITIDLSGPALVRYRDFAEKTRRTLEEALEFILETTLDLQSWIELSNSEN